MNNLSIRKSISAYLALFIAATILGGCGGRDKKTTTYSSHNFNAEKIYNEVVQHLKSEAFAFGADFAHADQVLAPHKNRLLANRSPDAYFREFNSVLKSSFRCSHLAIAPSVNTRAKEEVVEFPAPLDKQKKITRNAERVSRQWRNTPLGQVPIIRIPSFSLSEYDTNAVETYMNEATIAPAVILDVQNNSGGCKGNLMHALSFFVNPNQSMGFEVDRESYQESITNLGNPNATPDQVLNFVLNAHAGDPYHPSTFSWKLSPGALFYPRRYVYLNTNTNRIYVLADSESYSCAEIFPAVLKEIRNAKVVGESTRGAVLPSYVKTLSSAKLQYPVSSYFTPVNRTYLEGRGVPPTQNFSTTSSQALTTALNDIH